MQLKTLATNLIKFNCIAKLLAVGIAVSIGVPALAEVSQTTVKPFNPYYIQGGTEDNNGTILYICSTIVDGEYTPGKYYPPNQTCYVSWGGEEYGFRSNFQVLIAN
ncbi:MAG: DUF3421 domain-containing protein [Nostoc sp. DedQUE08]|uniref:DM9 repeat-containing protein n=1 Tax=Nostoc sp. DedQUE08 TaxID=3075393 RepID=UPI002AD4F7C0|nr:DM9 repeat-containing protein [Nostoc sp. DedQUE08]MDZ8069016.1 DUF3421 domain-containing protein [Nostoc sp. DedQUE08]